MSALEDFDTRDYRRALGSYVTGVTVVTATSPSGRRAGLTVNSFGSVSLDPPLVSWNLGAYSPSIAVFQEAGHFAVNVLAAHQGELALQFARSADDKFRGVAVREGIGGSLLVEGAIATFECRTAHRYWGGDHVIFLGAVLRYRHGEGEPLAFCRGAFGRFER